MFIFKFYISLYPRENLHLDTNACTIFNIIKYSLVSRVYKFLAFDTEIIIALLEYEHGEYRDIVEFQPRNETYSHDEDIHSQSRLNESFIYHEKFTYPELRNRGGSDDNRNFTRRTVDQSMQHTSKETNSVKCYQNSKTCVSRMPQETHIHCYEVSVTTDHQTICTPVASENNSLNHESQSMSVSSPESNGVETAATSEPTQFYEEIETGKCEGICEETCKSIDTICDSETERNFTSMIAIAAISLTKADLSVHPLRKEEEAPKKSRRRFKAPFCAIVRFLRRCSYIDRMFKWSRCRRKEPSSTVTTTYRNGVKIMQIVPTTDQEGNKRRAYVNVQTPDAIITRILSEFLESGEKKRKVLMTIMLQSKLDDKKEAQMQTSLSNTREINNEC